ncbi:MAG: FAD:protein FMN transferase [Lachnospiraceae bacterium]|nr:FAD:protein FMN transferase [Lachnospiraceae bacterium]
MRKRWAPIAAGVLLVVMLVLCVISVAESKRESSIKLTRSMDINHKKMEITAYALRGQMTADDLSKCLDGAFSLCRDYTEKYFDEESTESELGRIADLQSKGEGGRYELSLSPLLLVRSGLALTEFSSSAYDITAGALYRLFDDPEETPTDEEIAEALKRCGTAGLKADDNGIKLDDGVVLDLKSLADGYLCRVLEEYFVLCGISNVCVTYGDVVFVAGGKLSTQGALFWKHIEKEPFDVILPDAYTDLKEDKIEAYDGYFAWTARPDAAAANARYIDAQPFISSVSGEACDHDTGSVAVMVKNDARAWYAHALSQMFLALGKENSMKLLSSGLLESTFDLHIQYVRFESTSGETEVYRISDQNTESTTLEAE